jgi:hypothetical protein
MDFGVHVEHRTGRAPGSRARRFRPAADHVVLDEQVQGRDQLGGRREPGPQHLVGIAQGEARRACPADPSQDVPRLAGDRVGPHHVEGDLGVGAEEVADAQGPAHRTLADGQGGGRIGLEGVVGQLQQPGEADGLARDLVPPVSDALEFAREAELGLVRRLEPHEQVVGRRAEVHGPGAGSPPFRPSGWAAAEARSPPPRRPG